MVKTWPPGCHEVVGMAWMPRLGQTGVQGGLHQGGGVLGARLQPGAQPGHVIVGCFLDELDAQVSAAGKRTSSMGSVIPGCWTVATGPQPSTVSKHQVSSCRRCGRAKRWTLLPSAVMTVGLRVGGRAMTLHSISWAVWLPDPAWIRSKYRKRLSLCSNRSVQPVPCRREPPSRIPLTGYSGAPYPGWTSVSWRPSSPADSSAPSPWWCWSRPCRPPRAAGHGRLWWPTFRDAAAGLPRDPPPGAPAGVRLPAALLGTGLCGVLTTFSTLQLELLQ
jgi:hypothetical protein